MSVWLEHSECLQTPKMWITCVLKDVGRDHPLRWDAIMLGSCEQSDLGMEMGEGISKSAATFGRVGASIVLGVGHEAPAIRESADDAMAPRIGVEVAVDNTEWVFGCIVRAILALDVTAKAWVPAGGDLPGLTRITRVVAKDSKRKDLEKIACCGMAHQMS